MLNAVMVRMMVPFRVACMLNAGMSAATVTMIFPIFPFLFPLFLFLFLFFFPCFLFYLLMGYRFSLLFVIFRNRRMIIFKPLDKRIRIPFPQRTVHHRQRHRHRKQHPNRRPLQYTYQSNKHKQYKFEYRVAENRWGIGRVHQSNVQSNDNEHDIGQWVDVAECVEHLLALGGEGFGQGGGRRWHC